MCLFVFYVFRVFRVFYVFRVFAGFPCVWNAHTMFDDIGSVMCAIKELCGAR